MANRMLKPLQGCLESGIVKLYGSVTTSTSGTIGSSSTKGFTVTKTASETGRYTVTLSDQYSAFKSCLVNVVGAADAAYTTAKGLDCFIRGIDMSSKIFYIQFTDREAVPADAELEDAAVFYLEITLKNSSSSF